MHICGEQGLVDTITLSGLHTCTQRRRVARRPLAFDEPAKWKWVVEPVQASRVHALVLGGDFSDDEEQGPGGVLRGRLPQCDASTVDGSLVELRDDEPAIVGGEEAEWKHWFPAAIMEL